ncbi:DUF1120 domain-containing protein [Pseudomonas sp. RIT-PI-a]|uniref:DUF1120 domain-containing protein n=1 Tax=Pseudomonas sp. RIT-PI-a TaxID=1681194 RepID=UPI0006762705|nr:DUF1120 domain-containing protein [Pseudomonas sp. RIT-PI-a]KNC12614.1 hypothetical protein AC788_14670 [Pseudomonas sp. RIT-PI-a]
MHFVYPMAVGVALITALTSALAAPSVEVMVSGSIIPGGCTPSLNNPGIDHGKIAANELSADQPTSLAARPREATLLIACEAPTLYGIRAIDNRGDSVFQSSSGTYYGLGYTPAGEKIGAHVLRIVPARSSIDGKPAFVPLGSADASRWLPAEGNPRSLRANGQLAGFAAESGVSTGPVPIKSAVVGLSSSLVIAPTSGLTLTSEVPMEGSATLELTYL